MGFWEIISKMFGIKSNREKGWKKFEKELDEDIAKDKLKQKKRKCNDCQKTKRTTVTSREYTCRVCTPNKR